MHRAKKHMASKVAQTKFGRKIIQQAVGKEGNRIVDALKEATARHSTKEKAKLLKQIIYKMALKAKFMIDRGDLSLEDSIPLQKIWTSLAVEFLHALKPENPDPNISQVVAKLEDMKTAINQSFGENLTDKNKSLLNEGLDYYGSEDFVTAILIDAEFESEKNVLFENLQHLLELADDPTMQLNLEVVKSAPLFSDKYSSVISAVQRFWREVELQDTDLASKVYDNLFKSNPEYLQLFGGTKEKREHQLMSMFRMVIDGLDQFQKLTETIRAVGQRHVALGVPYEGFEQMWKSMDCALSDICGLRYRKQIRKSMELVFNQLADILRSCYPPGAEEKEAIDSEEINEEVKKFWESVTEQQELVALSLFESLFDLHPEYHVLFKGDRDDHIGDRILAMFNRVVLDFQNDQMKAEMNSLGKMHVGMGVPYDAFGHMWNSLDMSLVLIFGMQYTSRVRQHLSHGFKNMIVAMQEAYPPEKRC